MVLVNTIFNPVLWTWTRNCMQWRGGKNTRYKVQLCTMKKDVAECIKDLDKLTLVCRLRHETHFCIWNSWPKVLWIATTLVICATKKVAHICEDWVQILDTQGSMRLFFSKPKVRSSKVRRFFLTTRGKRRKGESPPLMNNKLERWNCRRHLADKNRV